MHTTGSRSGSPATLRRTRTARPLGDVEFGDIAAGIEETYDALT